MLHVMAFQAVAVLLQGVPRLQLKCVCFPKGQDLIKECYCSEWRLPSKSNFLSHQLRHSFGWNSPSKTAMTN